MKLATATGLLVCIASVNSFSFTNSAQITTDSKITTDQNPTPSHWSIEGDLQAGSVAGPSSPLFGLGGAYRIFDPVSLGLRGYLPMSHTVDNSTYAVQLYSRVRVVHGTNTDLFLEPSFSENIYTLTPFSSYGLACGVLTRVVPGLSVGVAGGLEAAKVVIDSVGLEDEDSFKIYPKVSLLANFNF